MRRRGRIEWAWWLLPLSAFVATVGASPARAWTDAQVHSAQATVVMDRSGRAEIELTLALRVRGGWLEGLEVAGLEPDATLLGEPRMISVPPEGEAPERFHPRTRIREPHRSEQDARIQLSFRRRESPRRGRYRIVLRYATDLGARLMPREEGEGWKGEWTLPAWRSGLDGVRITLTLPPGARFDPDAPPRALVDRERTDEAGTTTLVWERAHLPRTTDWQLRFELPEDAITPELATRQRVGEVAESPEPARASDDPVQPTPAAPGDAQTTEPATPVAPSDPFALPAWLVLWVALAMLLTGELFEREAVHRRARPRPLVRPRALRWTLLVALVGIDLALAGDSRIARALLALAVIVTGWQRSAEPAAPKPGRWMPTGSAAPLPGPGALPWLALGVGLLALLGGAWLLGDPAQPSWAVVALTAPLLHGGGRRLPPPLATRRAQLLELAGAIRTPLSVPAGLALVAHRDDTGVGDVRLRWTLARPRPGIHRLDIVLTDERGPGGLLRKARLLIVTEAGSVAERHLARLAPRAEAGPTRLPGGRLMRLYRIAAVPALLALLQHDEMGASSEAPPLSRAA